jgi:cation diffusion facilitator CzcD-associated flavoprotein CzcO
LEQVRHRAYSFIDVSLISPGQSGLALAAHLQHLGITYLVVDKASQAGDSWRARYDTIKSHTPTFSDHYPFLKYPSNWPRFLDKEHIIKWMAHYGDIMGLNIKRATLASKIEYNKLTQRYSVELQSKNSTQTITPKHVVLATGLFSTTPIEPAFPGKDLFRGQVYHTAEHQSAALVPDAQNKTVTIIGAGTSAHDVAQDFVNHGAKSVTMVQRQPIYVTSLDSSEKIQMALWNTPGVSTEDADLLGNSLPTAVVRTLSVGATQMMSANDKAMLDGLERAGLAVKRGEQGDSLIDHQLIKAGHFYIDQGASQMIIDGRIQIRRCAEGVQGYSPEGIVLADGTEIKSDIIILATGFEPSAKAIEALMGRAVMDKVGEMCTLDDSQERIGVSLHWFISACIG